MVAVVDPAEDSGLDAVLPVRAPRPLPLDGPDARPLKVPRPRPYSPIDLLMLSRRSQSGRTSCNTLRAVCICSRVSNSTKPPTLTVLTFVMLVARSGIARSRSP